MSEKREIPDMEELRVLLEWLDECVKDCNILLKKWDAYNPSISAKSPDAVVAILALEAAMRRQIRAVTDEIGEDQVPF